MNTRQLPTKPSPRDQLLSRPEEGPLPTPLPPDAPEARGYPVDPKPVPQPGQGDPDAHDPAPDEIGRPA